MVTTLERKRRIYEICSEHDIVIIEDDPYYYLQYSLTGKAMRPCLAIITMSHTVASIDLGCNHFNHSLVLCAMWSTTTATLALSCLQVP